MRFVGKKRKNTRTATANRNMYYVPIDLFCLYLVKPPSVNLDVKLWFCIIKVSAVSTKCHGSPSCRFWDIWFKIRNVCPLHKRKSHRMTVVTRSHPLGTMNEQNSMTICSVWEAAAWKHLNNRLTYPKCAQGGITLLCGWFVCECNFERKALRSFC